MKKILFVVALAAALCLSAAVANGAVFSETEAIAFTGNTGDVDLTVQQKVFHFKDIQPGEKLAVTWWIRNDGLCPIKITVNVGVTGSAAGPYLVAAFYPGTILYMGPSLQRNVALTVELNALAGDGYAGKDFTVTVTFNSEEDGNRQVNPSYDQGGWG